MSMPETIPAEAEAARALRDALIVKTLQPGESVWLVDERFVANGPTWVVTLVRQGEQGTWMHRRYSYDIPSDVLFFAGEAPISEADAAKGRKTGRMLG